MNKLQSRADWYDGLRDLRGGNHRALYSLLGMLPEMPTSFLDIGCGDGSLVETMSRLIGINEVMGIDLHHTSPLVHVADLHRPVELGRRFDLVICWEVVEHIKPTSVLRLCSTIANHVGRWLVFTGAQPDQVGFGHVNCQPPEYWREKLTEHGLEYAEVLTERLTKVWKAIPVFDWLRDNVQVFERGG